MNVVIYARFSSHSQTEQSIEGQLKECYAYAQRNDYKKRHNTSKPSIPSTKMGSR